MLLMTVVLGPPLPATMAPATMAPTGPLLTMLVNNCLLSFVLLRSFSIFHLPFDFLFLASIKNLTFCSGAFNGLAKRNVTLFQTELSNNGPLQACFTVYENFYSFFDAYPTGVYSSSSGNVVGGHCVKLIGWGEDSTAGPYWLLANRCFGIRFSHSSDEFFFFSPRLSSAGITLGLITDTSECLAAPISAALKDRSHFFLSSKPSSQLIFLPKI